jgi:molecular chaperone GrpE
MMILSKKSDFPQKVTNTEQKTQDTKLVDEVVVEAANPELTENSDNTESVYGASDGHKGASGGDNANPKKTGPETSPEINSEIRPEIKPEVAPEAKPGVKPEVTPEIDPVIKIQEALASERDRHLRLAAEYDNFRKRSAKERENTYCDARVEVILRLLPVYDNLERALKMECADEAFYKGIEMTMTQLIEILEGMDVRRISAVGGPFDPNQHNAVMTIVNPELGEKIVAEEFQKGFTIGQRVIRHSKVVVAN